MKLQLNTFSHVGSYLTPKLDEAKVIITEADEVLNVGS